MQYYSIAFGSKQFHYDPKSSESRVAENLNIIREEGGRWRHSVLQTFNLRTDSLDTSC